ncbi:MULTISPECIES: branched-chain amino acid transport system II carrier protein [Parachlamydia]|nr:branched-chain amino acid transport system II carrier protein [Parachlamydia acanthamoebae]
MNSSSRSSLAIGLAMFSMFFGAGNIVFPLLVGIQSESQNIYASIGLLISAIGVPLLGLIAMAMFEGNYKEFFGRMGNTPGFIMTALILGLIGPFGALPRCIALSHSTIKMYLPLISLWQFSLLSCLIIFWLSWRPSALVTILGYILTPFLLFSVLVIIGFGFVNSPSAPISSLSWHKAFSNGFIQGYQTLDLLGAFFFSSTIILSLKESVKSEIPQNFKPLMTLTLKASFICAILLGLVSWGFSWVAAFNSQSLQNVPKDELLRVVATQTLGQHASIFTIAAVLLACLTTEIALATAFSEFIHQDLSGKKISYEWSLVITLVIAFFVSLWHFEGIIHFLAPILFFCYPMMITLSIVNILYKLYHFKPVKTPLAIVLILSLAGFLFSGA